MPGPEGGSSMQEPPSQLCSPAQWLSLAAQAAAAAAAASAAQEDSWEQSSRLSPGPLCCIAPAVCHLSHLPFNSPQFHSHTHLSVPDEEQLVAALAILDERLPILIHALRHARGRIYEVLVAQAWGWGMGSQVDTVP